jgi:L-threonylcarbamoyladenylate synthase
LSDSSHATARVLPTHTPELFDAAVAAAAGLLAAGEVVALPTETVYGLAANAFNAEAVARIFEIKGRPAHNPIIVHVAGIEMARLCVAAWPEAAERLSRSFWPGPLTLVLPRSAEIPSVVTAGGPTIGIRWPSHPFIQAVIRSCGFPLAAPSANPSNRLSPTNATHVQKALGHKVALIVDGGQAQVGIESTVLDLTIQPARVLRPGMIAEKALVAVLGLSGLEAEIAVPGTRGPGRTHALKSPGLLRKHYAPKARLVIWSWENDLDLGAHVRACGVPAASVFVVAHSRIPSERGFGRVAVIPHDPEAFARAIYAELHACDEAGAGLIILEALPSTPAWKAIADRLQRAAA